MALRPFVRRAACFSARRPLTPAKGLGLALACSGFLVPGVASADLASDFATALEIDPTYATGVNGATDIAFAADGRAVITEKGGTVVIRRTDGTKQPLTGLFPDLDLDSEKGLTGVVADPTAPDEFFFYADNGPSVTDKHRVYRGVLSSADELGVDLLNPIVGAGVNPQDEGLEGPANHDGGGLFVYGRHLYVSVGDTGQNASPPVNKYASCLNKGNGKILRVNLDGSIPSDNPLSDETMVTACSGPTDPFTTAAPDKRVYAWGMRNPFRFWVDPHTGRMWIGDVGEITREEISVSDPASGYQGQHFGYPFREGTTDWNANGGSLTDYDCGNGVSPARACVPPVTDYSHAEGNCVIGGLIPEGCGWSDAFGGTLYYFFADNGAGWLRALEVRPDRSGVVSASALEVGSFPGSGPASIRQGPDGAIYLVNNSEGSVYELKPKAQTGSDCISTGGMGGTDGSSAGASASSGKGGSGATDAGGAGGNASAGKGGKMSAGGAGGSTTMGGSGADGASGEATSVGGAATSGGGIDATGGAAGGDEPGAGAAGTGDRASGGTAGNTPASGGGAGGVSRPGRASKSGAADDSRCLCRAPGSGGDSRFGLVAGALLSAAAVARRRRFAG